MIRRGLAVGLVLALGACAGREAVPVSAYQPRDDQMSCAEIDGEIGRNNAAIRSRVIEEHDRDGRNIMVGAVGLLLFWPALAALDLKDAAGTEMRALDARNLTLLTSADRRGCNVQAVLESSVALAEYKATFDEDGQPSVDQSAQAQQVQISAPSAETAALGQPSTAISNDNLRRREDLQDLMNAFLQGEIDAAEYKTRRTGLTR